MDHYTLRIVSDLYQSCTDFGTGVVDRSVAHENNQFPSQISANASMDVTFVLWRDQANNVQENLNGATVKLWARPLNSGLEAVLLKSATIATNTNSVQLVVPKNTVLPAWAAYSTTAFILECEHTAPYLTLRQDVAIVNPLQPDGDYAPSSADFPMDVAILTTNTTLANVWGWRIRFLDTSGGAFTLTLPEPGTHPGQRITIKVLDGATNIGTVAPGAYAINSTAGNWSMIPGDVMDIVEASDPDDLTFTPRWESVQATLL